MKVSDSCIEIIIPNWNGKELLVECLQSLRMQTCQEFCVTVVDNGSEDNSVGYLKEYFPEVKILPFDHNRGFSVAVNEGIRKSNADWTLLLNNDIEVAAECIAELHIAIRKYPDYDFFAIKMMSYHERMIFDGAGDAVLRGGVGYRIGTLEEDRGQYDNDRDIFGACAGAALYSRKFFRCVGYFDEDFFAYLEDVDLNMRAVRAGLKCRYLASAVVYHIGSATTGSKINPLTIRLSTKNNINVLVKNYPVSLFCRFLPVIVIYQLMWFFLVCKKGQIVAYCHGIIEALSQIRTMLPKREEMIAGEGISIRDFGSILTLSEREAVQSIMDRRSALGKGNSLLKTYSKLFL
jgi:GT2 family glycosyltransferase